MGPDVNIPKRREKISFQSVNTTLLNTANDTPHPTCSGFIHITLHIIYYHKGTTRPGFILNLLTNIFGIRHIPLHQLLFWKIMTHWPPEHQSTNIFKSYWTFSERLTTCRNNQKTNSVSMCLNTSLHGP